MARDLQIVNFRVGPETFGVDIALVHEIVRVPEITSVPDAPDFIEGVINLRGRIISLVDLRKRFGQKEIAPGKKNRIIVVEHQQRFVGLIVDSASEVLRVPGSDIEPPPHVFEQGGLDYVTGIAKVQGRIIILVDLGNILQRGELRRLTEFAGAQAVLAGA